MKSLRSSLLVVPLLSGLVVSGDTETWKEWTSSTPAPVPTPAAQGWTDWVTTTEYKDKSITITETEYQQTTIHDTVTLPPITISITETETEVATSLVTIISTTTEKGAAPPAETVTSATTEYTAAQGPPPSVTATTEYITITDVQVSQIQVTDTATVATERTLTDEKTVSATIISVSITTETVSVSFCPAAPEPPTLTGLVPCPTRIINEDYTPPTPLPDNYLWGCAPGYLCRPKKVGCNFESNPPADTYICAPEDCHKTEPLPPLDDYYLEDVNTSCTWFTPIDDYIYPNPSYFQLDFSIFKTLGQDTPCFTAPPPPEPPATTPTPPPPPPPSTTSTTPLLPPPPPPPPSTTSWGPWTTAYVPPPSSSSSSTWSPYPVVAPPVKSSWSAWLPSSESSAVSSDWATWSYDQPEPVVTLAPTSAGWGNWQSKDGWGPASPSQPARLARDVKLLRRADTQVYAGPECYGKCAAAAVAFENQGLQDSICESDSDFQNAIVAIEDCQERHKDAGGVLSQVAVISKGLSYCNKQAQPSTSVPLEPLQDTTTTPSVAAPSTSATSTPASTTEAPQSPSPSTTAPSSTQAALSPESSTTTAAPSTSSDIVSTLAGTGTATTSVSATVSSPIASYNPEGGSSRSMSPPTLGALLSLMLSVFAFALRA